MKRTQLYLLIFLALGFTAYVLVVNKPSGTLKEGEGKFALNDTSVVEKIFIADMRGNKVILQRQNSGWIVNQKYPVRSDYMNSLLSTIHNITISYPVSLSQQNTVVKQMASDNKKVEIFDRNGTMLKSYYIGGPNLSSDGTYMMMAGAKNPYVTAIPAFQGVVNTRYSTNTEEIRSGKIYDFDLNQILTVSVNYPELKDSSFAITVAGPDSFLITGNNGKPLTSESINKRAVRAYLQSYSFVNAEAFVNDLPKRDSILQSTPFCNITVTDRNYQPHSTVIYHMPRNSTSEQFDAKGNELLYDVDHFFATVNNGQDFVIIQTQHFNRLFKTTRFFLYATKN
ncbi:MAG: DUF4340 domain-containing protein [Chitinophagales bacterium]|nr:DUF4340 domain-containing protein [Chitinophagales bacterium]